jgi:hypothetical protein
MQKFSFFRPVYIFHSLKMNLHLKNYTISTEKTCSFVLKFCYDYYHLCTRMSHNQQTNIVSSSFDRTYNVSGWSNGEEVRLMKQSMYVRILSLEKKLLRVQACLPHVLRFLAILILSCMRMREFLTITFVYPRMQQY